MTQSGHEHTPSGRPARDGSTAGLYRALLDTLATPDQQSVLEALARHEDEVRAAEAAGVRPTEAF